MIEVRDLTKTYGTVKALRGVTFDVAKGEVIGLLGPNGAGKSTAMRIITGYLAPTSGSARVAGLEVSDDPVAAQRYIGYLPEGNPLYLELRLREALKFAAEMHGLRGAARNRAIERAIDAAGLRGMEHRKIITFSRGYRQRVGLAQAILHEPSVLILDEPSSGLDPNQQIDMRRFIRSLGETCAVIFSTHILPEVDAICDRALVISQGEMAAQGTTAEVIAQANLPGSLSVTVDGDTAPAIGALASIPVLSDVAANAQGRITAAVVGSADDAMLRTVAGALREAGVAYWGLRDEPVSLADAFAAHTVGRATDSLPIEATETAPPLVAAQPEVSNDSEASR